MKDTVVKIIRDQNQAVSDTNLDMSLFKEGPLSSIHLITIISELENNFSISIEQDEVDFENFDTINKILNFLKKKV